MLIFEQRSGLYVLLLLLKILQIEKKGKDTILIWSRISRKTIFFFYDSMRAIDKQCESKTEQYRFCRAVKSDLKYKF